MIPEKFLRSKLIKFLLLAVIVSSSLFIGGQKAEADTIFSFCIDFGGNYAGPGCDWPVIVEIKFDKPSYAPGDIITVTGSVSVTTSGSLPNGNRVKEVLNAMVNGQSKALFNYGDGAPQNNIGCCTWKYSGSNTFIAPSTTGQYDALIDAFAGTTAGSNWDTWMRNVPASYMVANTVVYGCMDSLANNYNVSATVSDNSCTYTVISLPVAPQVNGSCGSYKHYACGDGTTGINQSSAGSSYTWSCPGSNNGVTATCSETKPIGTVSASVTVNVVPKLDFTGSNNTGVYSASPTIDYNTTSNLKWSSKNVSICNATANGANVGVIPTSSTGTGFPNGYWTTPHLTANMTYVITCTGTDGSTVTKTVAITVPALTCPNGADNPMVCNTIGGVCINGTNNPNACSQCPNYRAYNGSSCVACTGGCSGGAGTITNWTGSLSCSNNAINPPSCSTCPAGKTMVSGTCVNNCSGIANNPPSCTTFNGSCINGADNPDTCDHIPSTPGACGSANSIPTRNAPINNLCSMGFLVIPPGVTGGVYPDTWHWGCSDSSHNITPVSCVAPSTCGNGRFDSKYGETATNCPTDFVMHFFEL